MRTFIWLWKKQGLKIALDDLFITMIKRWLGAKRIQITYGKK